LTLKGSFISLTELTECTEKDNYHFSFAAEAPANENRYAWARYWLPKPAPRADCFFLSALSAERKKTKSL
jgi:hypothetical protein